LNCRETQQSLRTESGLNIYPNPGTGKFTIDFTQAVDESCVIKVIDVIGKTLIESEFYVSVGNNTFELDLSSAPEGIYYVTLKSRSKPIKFSKITLQ